MTVKIFCNLSQNRVFVIYGELRKDYYKFTGKIIDVLLTQ